MKCPFRDVPQRRGKTHEGQPTAIREQWHDGLGLSTDVDSDHIIVARHIPQAGACFGE
jgi:hypothetical protein